jgi:hypothetical protein
MSGYSEYFRVGFFNDYQKAYDEYCMQNENPISKKDFELSIHDRDNSIHSKYAHLVTSTNEYYMIDPSGGPYITVGMNLNEFFNDNKKRIVDKIQFGNNVVIFTLK